MTYRRSRSHDWGNQFTPIKKCYESHPPLPLPGGKQIWGGNCGTPAYAEAQDYIALDSHMRRSSRSYPWMSGNSFYFPIPDMGVPESATQFHRLVEWIIARIEKGKRVHVGCIGGHGRTGMVLSAVYAKMSGDQNAIQYVRENYCKKAVESEAQVKWLMKECGVSSAPASKGASGFTSKPLSPWNTKEKPATTKVVHEKLEVRPRSPAKNRMSVWGEYTI